MTIVPIFIPVQGNPPPPLWRFEGDWPAEDQAAVEAILHRYAYRQNSLLLALRKSWLLVCRRYGDDLDYHAAYGGDISLYGDTVEEFVQAIETFYVTGKTTPVIFDLETVRQMDEDDWLNQVKQVRETDQAKHKEHERSAPTSQNAAAELIRQSGAYDLLRQVQRALLNGAGVMSFLEMGEEYDSAIVLVWQGPVSAARKPDKVDESYSYILVGAKENSLWINGKRLPETTMEALKRALLEACKNPASGQVR